MLDCCDSLAVMVHASTDATSTVVWTYATRGDHRISWTQEANPEWNEADYRGRMLKFGRALGGTHFAVIDADEMVCASAAKAIRAQAETLKAGECLSLPWIHCWRSFDKYRSDKSKFGRARVPFIFRDGPGLIYEPKPDGYQLHCRAPDGVSMREWGERDKGEGVLHFQHVDWERCEAKQRGYIEQEMRRWPLRRNREDVERQYLATLDETGLETKDVPKEWLSQS